MSNPSIQNVKNDIMLVEALAAMQERKNGQNPDRAPEGLDTIRDRLVKCGLLEQDSNGKYTPSTKKLSPKETGVARQVVLELMKDTGQRGVYEKNGRLVANPTAEKAFQGQLLSLYSRISLEPQQHKPAPNIAKKQAQAKRVVADHAIAVEPVPTTDAAGRVILTELSLRKSLRESGDFIGEKFNAAKQWTNQAVQSTKDFFTMPATAPASAAAEENSTKAALKLIAEDIKKPFKAIAGAVSSVTNETIAKLEKAGEFMTQAVAAIQPKKMARAFLVTGLALIGTGLIGMISAKTGNPEPAKAEKGHAKTSAVHVAKTVARTDTTQSVKAARPSHATPTYIDTAPKHAVPEATKQNVMVTDTLANASETPAMSVFKANVIDTEIAPRVPKSIHEMKDYAAQMLKLKNTSFALSHQFKPSGYSQ